MRPRLLLLVLIAATNGCLTGYKLGPTNGDVAGARTIKFQPFINRTAEPRVTEYLGNSLRKQIQKDGTFRLETSGSPDIMVTGEITHFNRSGLSYDPNDVLTPQEYTLSIEANVRAINVSTGKTILDTRVRGQTYIRISTDEYSSERQAIPILTDVLARNAVSLLVDGKF